MTNAAHKDRTPCEHCKETFKGTVGLATHMRKAHTLNPDGSHYVESKKAKPTAIVVKTKRQYITKKKDDHHYGPKQPLALYAYITANLEAVIHRVAFEHDLPEKHFAKGYFDYILHSEVR